MPTVILEALASGRHVIATDVGATAALLADAPGCRLIAPSASELTAALADFAAAPPTPRRFDLSRYAWSPHRHGPRPPLPAPRLSYEHTRKLPSHVCEFDGASGVFPSEFRFVKLY